jgi:transcriptional antiterminator
MLDLNDAGNRVTIANIAKILNCSSRTIHRNMSQQLRKEKDLLNIENEKI